MKNSKTVFAILAIAVAVLLAGQPVARAGEGLEDWPTTPGVRGETFYGVLLIVYTVVEVDPEACDSFEPSVSMTFHLTLYKNRANSWNFLMPDPDYTGDPPTPLIPYTDEGMYCLTLDLDGTQQMALMSYLNNEVRPRLKGGRFSELFLTQVENDYITMRTSAGPPDYVVADIEIVGVR